MFRKTFASLTALILAMAWILTGKAEAQLRPSPIVLLPYFEVDLGNSGKTTMFAVGNALDQAVDVQIEVRTNWGIPVIGAQVKLAAHEVRTFNLRDWIAQGKVPNKTLKPTEKAMIKAAFAGQKAPDNLYYSTAVAPNLAVGSVVIRVVGGSVASALWGDFLLVDPALNISMGDDLVNLERAPCGSWLCNRHALRFLSGAAINADTDVVIWTDRVGQPSKTSYPESQKVEADGIAYNEAGQPIGNPALRLLPLQVVSVATLGLREPFGWIDLRTEEPTFIGLHFDNLRRDGAALQAYCLKDDPPPGPGIEIVKRTNGEDANTGPGPRIAVGSPVTWDYTVRNTGGVRLTKVKVTDDDASLQVKCPKDTLEIGETMVCTAQGTAVACQYQNIGTAVGTQPNGSELEAADPSHYFGGENSKIDIELAVNGDDADNAPGLGVQEGAPLQWTYVVTNAGDVLLTDIKVTDDTGLVPSCGGKTSLRPGESMTCTASGTAASGDHHNVGAAAAKGPCGDETKDSDPANYKGTGTVPPIASISIKKYTNGDDADAAPGPYIKAGDPVHWTYEVKNTGGVNLTSVHVTDNRGVAVSCPKTSLQPNEAMTCTGNGTATAGQYENIGTAVGTPPSGPNVTDSDPSHYFGQIPTGGQGCTPGYWKNHTDSWPPTGYSPSQKVQNVFGQAANYPSLGNASLLDALSFKGGSSLEGAAEILLRAGVAALLDASHPGVNYPRTTASVISDVNAALASGDRDTMTSVGSQLDSDNNLGCPLN